MPTKVRESLLLRAALAQFVEHGFAASRMEDVAARAGVAKGTPYVYFSSKEALLRSVISEFLCAEVEALVQDVQKQLSLTSAADIIRRDVVEWWTRVADSPAAAVFKLLVSDVPGLPHVAEFFSPNVFGRLEHLMAEVVRAGVGRQQLSPQDVTATVAAMNLPLIMFCVHRHTIERTCATSLRIDARDFIENHMRRILRDVEILHGPASEVHPPSNQLRAMERTDQATT